MSGRETRGRHPDLERYYDTETDRTAIDAHLVGCAACRAWFEDIHERLRDLPCIDFVELVTDYLEASADHALRARIEDHLRLCEGCRSYLDEMRSTVATIARIRRPIDSPAPSEPARAALVAAFRAWRRDAP